MSSPQVDHHDSDGSADVLLMPRVRQAGEMGARH
jgi:hypothetical protein